VKYIIDWFFTSLHDGRNVWRTLYRRNAEKGIISILEVFIFASSIIGFIAWSGYHSWPASGWALALIGGSFGLALLMKKNLERKP
jgi:hypothetical protein